jgi:hypothetical protein
MPLIMGLFLDIGGYGNDKALFFQNIIPHRDKDAAG